MFEKPISTCHGHRLPHVPVRDGSPQLQVLAVVAAVARKRRLSPSESLRLVDCGFSFRWLSARSGSGLISQYGQVEKENGTVGHRYGVEAGDGRRGGIFLFTKRNKLVAGMVFGL